MKNILFKLMLAVVLLGLTAPVWATGPVAPAIGAYCWNANTESDLAGYYIQVFDSVGPHQPIDAKLPLTVPPACSNVGKVGAFRDQSADVDGDFVVRVSAYDVAGNESTLSTGFAYELNSKPPATPTGCEVF